MTQKTAEQRAGELYPSDTVITHDMVTRGEWMDAKREACARTIREHVEPLEADNASLRALAQVLVDAVNTSQEVIFKMTDGPGRAAWGPQLDINDSALDAAKEHGIVPTNTTEG